MQVRKKKIFCQTKWLNKKKKANKEEEMEDVSHAKQEKKADQTSVNEEDLDLENQNMNPQVQETADSQEGSKKS